MFYYGSIGSQIAKLVRESTGLEERSSVSLFLFDQIMENIRRISYFVNAI